MENTNLEELISEETKKRLDEMEREDYEFPKKITGTDIVLMIVLFFLSTALIALCMTGVIN